MDVCGGIGDLILLHQFNFTVWNEMKLEARYIGSIEGIYNLKFENEKVKVIRSLTMSNLQYQLMTDMSYRIK